MNKAGYTLLFGLYPEEFKTDIFNNTKTGFQGAANNLQTSIVKSLVDNDIDNIEILNSLFIGAYPKRYKKLFIKKGQFEMFGKVKGFNLPFINLPIYKHISKYFSYKRKLIKKLKKVNGDHIIIGYSITPSITRTIKKAKKKFNNVKAILIVPDLVEYMNTSSQKGFKDISSVQKARYKDLEYVDGLIVLTEPMMDKIPFKKPFRVIEGIMPADDNTSHKDNDIQIKRYLTYTGGLNIAYGIGHLLEEFDKIDNPSVKLVLCGSGDAEHLIKEYADKNKNIIYKGLVSQEEARKIQSESLLLINPRRADGEFTKYSFPSKLLEYLTTSRPIISYKLPGIPSEYNDFIYFIKDCLKDTIVDLSNRTEEELSLFGSKAKEFAYNRKTPLEQGKVLISLIKEVTNYD